MRSLGSSRPFRRMLVAGALVLAAGAPSASAADGFTVKTLRFATLVGPQQDQRCEVVGDLYTPDGASKENPVPAILTTNGFGGSKNDQAPQARAYARRGYAVLSYSGLGFGGSDCKITLDDPDWDGRAGSQLITFLGGGSAALDGTRIDYVVRDAKGSDGRPHEHDPRVGMLGGSYGGQIQFAVAGVDPRLDTIVPQITWNDLSYSLAPNNTSFASGVSYTTPGVEKVGWTSLFFALGIARGIDPGLQGDPARLAPCPNFADRACAAKLQMDALGYPNADTIVLARHASVASYMERIRIPTFLQQGQSDTLFNLQESLATYRALKARKVPVRLFWHHWGHSGGAAEGELDQAEPEKAYETRQTLAWFEHHLKGKGPTPPQDFQFFRDWVTYDGDAGAAYATAAAYPVGKRQTFVLDGTDALTPAGVTVRPGAASLLPPALGAPASFTEISALNQTLPVTDVGGTFVSYSSKPLAADIISVGVPTLTVRVGATAATDPAAMPVVFAKLYDVAPDGTIELTHRLISPARVADPSKPLEIELPGVVHRYAKGHTLRLVIAGSDAAYRGNNLPLPIQILTGPDAPSTLVLPTDGDTGMKTGLEAERALVVAARRRCASRRTIRFGVRLRRGERIVRADVTLDGKRRTTRRGRALKPTVVLRGRAKGRALVRVVFRTNRGRRIVRGGSYALCVRRG